jgi:branched-chain amino acid aminotransferase
VPIAEAKVSVMTTTLHYGVGCFGGLRAYWSEERQELFAFRLIDHYTRFLDSCKLLMSELPYSAQQLADITCELLRKEGFRGDVYIRPLHYKADLHGGLQLHGLADELTIYALPRGGMPPEQGLSVGTSSWRRIDDTMIPARGKLIGAYVNSALVKSEAVMGGYDDAVVLTQDGHVSELSGANIFMVRGGVLVTPPITDNVLEGVTRRSIIELARAELGMTVSTNCHFDTPDHIASGDCPYKMPRGAPEVIE